MCNVFLVHWISLWFSLLDFKFSHILCLHHGRDRMRLMVLTEMRFPLELFCCPNDPVFYSMDVPMDYRHFTWLLSQSTCPKLSEDCLYIGFRSPVSADVYGSGDWNWTGVRRKLEVERTWLKERESQWIACQWVSQSKTRKTSGGRSIMILSKVNWICCGIWE